MPKPQLSLAPMSRPARGVTSTWVPASASCSESLSLVIEIERTPASTPPYNPTLISDMIASGTARYDLLGNGSYIRPCAMLQKRELHAASRT